MAKHQTGDLVCPSVCGWLEPRVWGAGVQGGGVLGAGPWACRSCRVVGCPRALGMWVPDPWIYGCQMEGGQDPKILGVWVQMEG